MDFDPLDERETEALQELRDIGGSKFLAADVSSDHVLPSAKVEICLRNKIRYQPVG